LDAFAVLQPQEKKLTPTLALQVLRRGRLWFPDINPRSKMEVQYGACGHHDRSWGDTNDFVRFALQVDLFAEDLRIGAEAPAPERITDHHNPVLPRYLFFGNEFAAERHWNTNEGEKVCGYDCALDSLRFSIASHVPASRLHGCNIGKECRRGSPF